MLNKKQENNCKPYPHKYRCEKKTSPQRSLAYLLRRKHVR